MTKYNELELELGGKHYIFVTRGRSKPFSADEAVKWLEYKGVVDKSSSEKEEGAGELNIPDDKQRRHLFLQDLQQGIDFCVKKYGVSADSVISEARRIAPGHDAERLSGQKS